MEVVTDDEAATRALGARLARHLRPGDVVLLHGDLGAGKTTLTQGIAGGLGVPGPVGSPTFALAAEHDGRAADGRPLRLLHLDLYRLAGPADLDSFGFADYLDAPDAIAVVEWPERAAGHLPDDYLLVRLDPLGGGRRRLSLEAVPADGRHAPILAALADSP